MGEEKVLSFTVCYFWTGERINSWKKRNGGISLKKYIRKPPHSLCILSGQRRSTNGPLQMIRWYRHNR